MLKELSNGLQHIGIPVTNLKTSIKFYESLGFELIHQKNTYHNDVPVECAFLKLHELVIELFKLKGELLEEVKGRKDGHIDHFAIDVKDVDKLFEWSKKAGYDLIDQELQFIDFYENGVRFFRIMGPDYEVIELNEKL